MTDFPAVIRRQAKAHAHRHATHEDRRFIVSAWSMSYKDSHSAGMIGTETWADVMHREIERILDWPNTKTLVAFEPKDPEFVYGFICGNPDAHVPVVFYCYTKAAFRRHGFARGLFSALHVDPDRHFLYACRTAVVSRLGGKLPAAKFDPSKARYQE